MKKLTWALLSLMLFLGLGTAFAQDGDGSGETPTVTVPAPDLSPADGATVTPKGKITPLGADACLNLMMQGSMVYAMYIWDDNATELTATEDLNQTLYNAGEAAYKVDMWVANDDMDGGDWLSAVVAPEDAGSHTLRVRLVAGSTGIGGASAQAKAGDFDDAAYTYGAEISATYTVAGEAVVETVDAPTLSPASGAVALNGKVNIEYDEKPAHYCYYVIDNPDFDFTAFENMDDISEEMVMEQNGWVNITKPMSIRAAICKVNMGDGSIAAWSDPVTGTYTIAQPAAPTFNPNGGEIEVDADIAMETTTQGAKIYYTSGTTASFVDITTEEALDAQVGSTFEQYSKTYKPTLEDFMGMVSGFNGDPGDKLSISAAAALIADGNVTWSAVTTREFTVAGGDEPTPTPGDEVERPTITPANDAIVHIGDEVTITCATNGAKIYYTTDGTFPYTSDKDGNPTGIAEAAIEYEEAFELTEDMLIEQAGGLFALKIRAVATKDNKYATASVGYNVYPDAPEFSLADGEVAFGAELEIESNLMNATIRYTLDGTTPTVESKELGRWETITITKDMTVKAIAVLGQYNSGVTTGTYTVKMPEETVLTLSPMQDDTVGKNVGTGISFSDGTPMSAGWIQQFPAVVYYTVDGMTVPSKAAYDAQSDKENGAIKMLSVKWEDQWGWFGPVSDGEGNFMSLTFTEATHLKAIGYLMDGDNVLVTTALFDQELKIKSEADAAFAPVSGTEVALGGKIVITNPNPYPEKPAQPEDWDDEEAVDAYYEAMDEYDESIAEIPATELYFSFDGTKPTVVNRYADDLDVFSTPTGGNIEITIRKDEKGYYAYVPEILGHVSDADKIRLGEDGKLSVEILCVTTAQSEAGGDGPMPMSAKWGMPGGAAPFKYGSDFMKAEYTVVAPAAATLTFDPATGSEVDETTAVAITADQNVEIFYMMFESEEAAKAAEWDQEEAESYSAELKPVLSPEKNTIKAAYAYEGSDVVETTFFYATYKVKELPAITLTFNPASGSEVEDGTTVTVTASRETEIFYCLYADKAAADADTTFMDNAKEVKEDGKPVITKAAPYLRCAVTDHGEMKYFDATYTVVKGDDVPGNPTLPETVKAPVFVPAAGEVEKGTAITWTWDEEYTEETYPLITVAYVVNGKDEDLDIDVDKFGELWDASQEEDETTVREEGKVYLYRTDVDDAYPYQVEKACTVKARLILGTVNDEGEVEIALSKLVEAAYTVKTANEGEELYGVSVYPNPSNGTFNLELPVAATVEVFAANGVLMQRFNANEGNVSLNVNRAGIYFLRITGEGRTSVKRLIVR